eukprot:976078-Prymnesium_polylepis.2
MACAREQQLVERVERALARALQHEARLLEQVDGHLIGNQGNKSNQSINQSFKAIEQLDGHLAAAHTPLAVKKQLGELAEARRVVVVSRRGVAKRLEDDLRAASK